MNPRAIRSRLDRLDRPAEQAEQHPGPQLPTGRELLEFLDAFAAAAGELSPGERSRLAYLRLDELAELRASFAESLAAVEAERA